MHKNLYKRKNTKIASKSRRAKWKRFYNKKGGAGESRGKKKDWMAYKEKTDQDSKVPCTIAK